MDIVSGIVTCTKCKMRVIPRKDGTCPSCQAVILSEQGSTKRKTSSAQPIRKVKQKKGRGGEKKDLSELLSNFQEKYEGLYHRADNKDPSELISIILMLVMLVAIYGITYGINYFIGRIWTGSFADKDTLLGTFYLGMIYVVTHLAVRGIDPEKRGCLRYFGLFILSTIPFAGWIVFYWAGKGLARMLTPK